MKSSMAINNSLGCSVKEARSKECVVKDQPNNDAAVSPPLGEQTLVGRPTGGQPKRGNTSKKVHPIIKTGFVADNDWWQHPCLGQARQSKC